MKYAKPPKKSESIEAIVNEFRRVVDPTPILVPAIKSALNKMNALEVETFASLILRMSRFYMDENARLRGLVGDELAKPDRAQSTDLFDQFADWIDAEKNAITSDTVRIWSREYMRARYARSDSSS